MDVSDDALNFDFSSKSGENKNTKRKTETDMRIFSAYLISLNELRPIEALPPCDLDRYLTTFFSVIKKHDGNEYEPASLRGMLCSVERFLRSKDYPCSVTRDTSFLNTRNMLKEKQKILKQIAKTEKKTKPGSLTASTVERLKQLYNAKEFGPYSPTAIINSLCFAFVIHMKIRKAVDHKQLLWGDIALKNNGENEYLCYEPVVGFDFIRPKLSGISQFRIYGQTSKDSSMDPIYIYKLYASKRPRTMMSPDCPFYLGIALVCNSIPSQQQWFKPCPMGVNKLSDLVRMIRDITGSLATLSGDQSTIDNKHPTIEILENHVESHGEDATRDGSVDGVESHEKEDTVADSGSINRCLPITSIHQPSTHSGKDTSSETDVDDIERVKKTILGCLNSLNDSGQSVIWKWLTTLTGNSGVPADQQVDEKKFIVTFSLTPSQIRSQSPFTISADVKSKVEITYKDRGTHLPHMDADLDAPYDMTHVRSNEIIKCPPPAHSNSNSYRSSSDDGPASIHLRKRTLSESVLKNSKYFKDINARHQSVDDRKSQPENSYHDLREHDKQSPSLYPFEVPKEYGTLYPPCQSVDPRFAQLIRHGLIAGYQNIVNDVDKHTSVTKTTE